ncbi:unnamed protein product [Adineta ricciae]|uniref:Uncharacterized protein n=1 Tax=Adineta ricciae TaxID=249248 RepID=A0A815RDU6_ADIRI|nr:unnamed protein product [Adineta ricciae]CAF1475724.1 unnamed protein product [Adineta ricciae]
MNIADVSSSSEFSLNSEKVKQLLRSDDKLYKVIKNESSSGATWWNTFGFPAKLDENNEYQRIFGHVSCFKCYQTFNYSSKSGTTRLKAHEMKCKSVAGLSSLPLASSIEIDHSSSSSSAQSILTQHGFLKSKKLSEKDAEHMKLLCTQWISTDLRPFSIIEDSGFRSLAQELIRIGHKYGVIDIDNVLRSRHTLSRNVYDLADCLRECIKDKLREPLQHRSVTICPDFWTDPYKNISYLGLNICFVDNQHRFYSIDLFCRPFLGIKSADLIVKALESHLSEFGISNLAMVNIISDRGSNFVKAFEPFSPLFCFGHRLNNVLKTTFFHHEKKKKKQSDSSSTTTIVTASNNNNNVGVGNNDSIPKEQKYVLSSEESSDDDEEYVLPLTSIPIIKKKKTNTSTLVPNDKQSLRNVLIDDIPVEAKYVLSTLKQCKRIVKYIKKSGLNKDIENNGGSTVHQAIDVRWLSIMNSLKSILKSYKVMKKILINKQQQRLFINVDEKKIKQIMLLLEPFQDVMKMIQTGNSPSLHLVLLCTQTLRDVLKSFDSLVNYHENNGEYESNDIDDELFEELEGIKFFLNRMRGLFNEMFELDIRHYSATLLHPKYRSLKACTYTERAECYKYVRQQMQLIYIEPNESNQKEVEEPAAKKFKGDLFRRFESDGSDVRQEDGGESGNESEEYPISSRKTDELDRYLNLEFEKLKLSSNPLTFWNDQHDKFPLLSCLARRIFSIPATSTSVERQFSGAGLVIQERRTSLNPEQLDNILLIRSMRKYEHLFEQ